MGIDECLMHYGVLGMKWGVHRAKKFAKKSAKASRKAEEASESLKESRRVLKVEGKKHQVAAREKDLMSSRQRAYAYEKADDAKNAQKIADNKRAKAEKYAERGTGFRSWNNNRKAKKAQAEADASKEEAQEAFRQANRLKTEADEHRAEIGGMKNDVVMYKDLRDDYISKAKKYAAKSGKYQDKYGVVISSTKTKRGRTKVKAALKG